MLLHLEYSVKKEDKLEIEDKTSYLSPLDWFLELKTQCFEAFLYDFYGY